jgi:hypothetical protein
MTAETLSTEVFHCLHCDRFGLPFVRDATGKFYRFPPTIGATGPAPLLFVGINPRGLRFKQGPTRRDRPQSYPV